MYCSDSFYSLRLHAAKCQYRAKCEKDRESVVEVVEGNAGLRSDDQKSLEIVGGGAELAGEFEEGRETEKEVEMERSVPDFCLSFAEVALRMARRGARKEIEKMMGIILDADFDAKELGRHVKGLDDCERIVGNSNEDVLSKEGFTKEVLRAGSGSCISQATLYKKDVVSVLREQMWRSGSGSVYFSSGDVPAGTAHPVSTKFGKEIERKVRERVMRSPKSEVLWNARENEMPKSFSGLIQIYSDKTATSLKCSALVAYPVHVVWLNFTARQRRYLIDHGYTLVGFLPVGSEEGETVHGDSGIEESVSVYGFTLSEVVPLESFIPHTSSMNGRRERMSLLRRAIRSLLEPLEKSFERGFDIFLKSGEARRCFPIVVSYCCDIPEAKDVSAIRHGHGRYHPCVRCHITYEDMVRGRGSPSRVLSGTIETRRRVKELKEAAERMSGREERGRRREALNEIGCLLSAKSLAEWPSSLEELCGSGGLVVEDLYSMFTFEPLHNLHLGVSRLLKTCLVQYLSSDEIYSHPCGPNGKRKRLSSVRMALLRACNAILAHVEEKYALPGLHVDFAKTGKTTQLNGLFTADGLRGMLEGKDYYAVDMVFPFVAAFIDRSLGFEEKCELTRMNVLYIEIINKVLVDHRDRRWREGELLRLRGEIREFKSVVEGAFASHCPSGLYTLKYHLLDHLVEDLERFGSISFMDAGPFEHFNVVIKQSYRMTSRRLTTRMDETVQRMGSAVDNVRRPRERRNVGGDGASVLKRQKCVEGGGGYLVRDGECLSLGELCGAIERAGEGTKVGNCFGEVLVDLFKKDVLVSFAKCVREWICVGDAHVCDGDIGMVFVKSGFIKGGFCPSLNDYDRDLNMIKIPESRGCVLHEQRVYANHEFGAQKKLLNSFVLIRGESEGMEEVWVGKVLLLFRCVEKGRSGGAELAYVRYMECVPPLNNVEETLGCVCLQWATADSVEEQDGAERESGAEGGVVAGEWFGVIPFQSILSTVHIVRANIAVQPFTTELPWTSHRFYINRFFREPGMRRNRVHEQ